MKKLVFATNNTHKLSEVQSILNTNYEIISLKELDCFEDIPETANTLEGNALLKAKYIYDKFKIACIADDTGLEIDALGGEPGVFSARYAGENNDAQKNMEKVLNLLGKNNNRTARFRTVIALIYDEKNVFFEGKIEGNIALQPKGNSGFGYDPIFVPVGYNLSFAELGVDEKNKISHRAIAIEKLTEYLNAQSNKMND